MINHPNDEIWNEHDWELYIRSFEDQNQRLKSFYQNVWGSEQPSWYRLIDELNSEKEVVDAFIEEELLIEESFFPDDDEDFEIDEDDDDMDDDLFGFGTNKDDDDSDDDDDDDDDDEEDGSEEAFFTLDENSPMFIEMGEMSEEDENELDLYDRGREIAVSILKWNRRRSNEEKSLPHMQRLVTIAMQVPTKIAAGFGFGFDPESIGGNIAYCKRALRLCNEAMDIFTLIHEQKAIQDKSYLFMQEELMLLRNDLGVYVQELRDMFTEATGE